MHVQNERPQSIAESEAQARGDFRWLLDDPRGRRIVRSILRWSQIDETGPTSGIEQMAYATGARMVGNLLKASIIKHGPESWIKLEAEHVQELAAAARKEAEDAVEQERQAEYEDQDR